MMFVEQHEEQQYLDYYLVETNKNLLLVEKWNVSMNY